MWALSKKLLHWGGMFCGEWEGLKSHISPSMEKKNIPHVPKKQNRGWFVWKFQSWREVWQPLIYCCLPAPQSSAKRGEFLSRQLVDQRSTTNASAETSKQGAEHVNIIFYHFYLIWIGQRIWDAGHDVDSQNWLAFLGHWKPFLWHFNAELKLISAIRGKKCVQNWSTSTTGWGDGNGLGSHARSVAPRPRQWARSCRGGDGVNGSVRL